MHGPSANRALSILLGAMALSIGTAAAVAESSTTDVDAVTTASAGAQHDCYMTGYQHGGTPEDMLAQFREELALTGQQQTDIQIIMSDYAERFRDLARLGRTTAEELLSMAPDDPAYRTKTDEASALAANSAAEMVVLLAEMRGKLHAVLTDAQRETLRQKIAEKKQQLEEQKQQNQDGDDSHDRPLDQFIQ